MLFLLEVVLPSIIWMAPFFSGGGYCSEAISFVRALEPMTSVRIVQHGDAVSQAFLAGLSSEVEASLSRMHRNAHVDISQSVVVCHSEPGAWWQPNYHPVNLCPPAHHYQGAPKYVVGRTMFETDRLPAGWKQRLNRMDSVWVPTQFHRRIFEQGGVDPSKLVVIGEAVDSVFFDPGPFRRQEKRVYPLPHKGEGVFAFLSVFKWEERKGWKFLLRAFVDEFSSDQDKENQHVHLYIKTNAYHDNLDDIWHRIHSQIGGGARERNILRRQVHILPERIPDRDMPSLYAAADCFVLPSRGEGWGRPHVEAMAMALPVITTHWSGPEEYLTSQNGYPLDIDGLEEVESGAFKGHKWAKPSVRHLRELMRHVVDNPQERVAKGARARDTMVRLYCPQCLANQVKQAILDMETKQIKEHDEL